MIYDAYSDLKIVSSRWPQAKNRWVYGKGYKGSEDWQHLIITFYYDLVSLRFFGSICQTLLMLLAFSQYDFEFRNTKLEREMFPC